MSVVDSMRSDFSDHKKSLEPALKAWMKLFRNLLLSSSLLFSWCSWDNQKEIFIKLWWWSLTWTYHMFAWRICDVINNRSNLHWINCSVISTAWSSDNADLILSWQIDAWIIQSDVASQIFDKQKWTWWVKLNSITALYAELVTLVVDSSISDFNWLKWKNVNTWVKWSWSLKTAEDLLKACWMDQSLFQKVSHLLTSDMIKKFWDDQLDAFFYVTWHPSRPLQILASNKQLNILPLWNLHCVKNIVKDSRYFISSEIPWLTYKWVNTQVDTFWMQALLVVPSTLDENIAFELTKVVSELNNQNHPIFKWIDNAKLSQATVLPFHPWAKKFFEKNK